MTLFGCLYNIYELIKDVKSFIKTTYFSFLDITKLREVKLGKLLHDDKDRKQISMITPRKLMAVTSGGN